MRLEQYLECLANCPEKRAKADGRLLPLLTTKYGVYDNWPIFLKEDFDTFIRYLVDSGNYIQREDSRPEQERFRFNYRPGTIVLQAMNYIPGAMTTSVREPFPKHPKDNIHSKRQRSEYNMALILHPYQKNKIANLHWTRAMASVIQEIGQYAIQSNTSLCFPNSIGWKNLEDYSQIIYHP